MPSKTPPIDLAIAPQLAEDIEISRREIAEGKGIPHEVVFAQMDKMLRTLKANKALSKHHPKTSTHIPTADILTALEEGNRITTDPTRKTYDNLNEFRADLEK